MSWQFSESSLCVNPFALSGTQSRWINRVQFYFLVITKFSSFSEITNCLGYFQRITATVNSIETKRLLMDLDISMRSSACPYTVQFYGAMFREGDVWICMEVMDTSIDKFYAKSFDQGKKIPEQVLGKIAFSVSNDCN